MQNALNVKTFRQFAQQVKGARVGEIAVARARGPKGVAELRYTARCPKTRRVWNGEWILPAKDGEKAEADFYALAEKEFVVTKPEADTKDA